MKRKKCRCWWCFRRATKLLLISAGSHNEVLRYCERHARIVDEVMQEERDKMSKLHGIQINYEKMGGQKCSKH